jgi:hypothetical protein
MYSGINICAVLSTVASGIGESLSQQNYHIGPALRSGRAALQPWSQLWPEVADLPKPLTPKTSNGLVRRANERRAVRAELAALAVRAHEVGLVEIKLVLDLAMALDPGQDWPPGVIGLPVADE